LTLWLFALLSLLKIDALETRGAARALARGRRIRPARMAACSRARGGIDPEQRSSQVKA
jgi:hypothetical protein